MARAFVHILHGAALCGLLVPSVQAEPDSVGDLASPRTPEQARSELRERGIPYTQLAFLERVKKGDLFAAELFRDAGMDLHAPTDDHGWTALMGAAKEGRLEAEFLVEHGAGIHAQDYPRWHLPEGALARLGKGSIRERDRTIAYSPDGTRLAVATTLGIWLYDVRIPNEATYAWNLESDAGYFWSRWVYEIPTYNEVFLLPGRGVSSVSFSPDGNTLASGGREILLWDVATGQRKATLKGVGPVSFSPDGNTLASGGRDSTVVLWDVDSRQQKAALKGHTEWVWVSSVSFSPDGNTLASGGRDSTVVLWDVDSRQQKAALALPSLWDRALSVSFSPDGNTLASGTTKGNIVLWDVDSRRQKAAFGHWDGVSSVSFSPDGNTLASGSDDLQVRLWDVATGQRKAVLQGHWAQVSSVSFSPDGNTLASSSFDGNVVLWDVDSRQPQSTFSGHTWTVNSLAFLPDGNTLVSGGWDKTIRLWDVVTGRLKATRLTGHRDGVLSVVLSPDGNTLASVSRDGIRLWDVDSDQRPTILKGQQFSAVSFSPDGTILASGGREGNIVLWDVATGQLKATLKGYRYGISSVLFSPDGKTLVSGVEPDGPILLWNVGSGQQKVAFTGHRKSVRSLAFSPDGNTLASGSRDSTVVLWDVDSRQRKATLTGHTGSVSSVSFSPDGNTLASGSGEILLWDVDSRQRKAVLKGGGSVSFSPDGKTLASSSGDGTILLWDVSLYITPSTPPAIELSPPLPTQTALLANFPNPFNPDTYIPYQLHAPASVRLTIYDIRGGLVLEIDVGDRAAGQYLTSTRAAHWDGRDQRGQHVASGVYLYRLQAGPVAHVRKMLLVK